MFGHYANVPPKHKMIAEWSVSGQWATMYFDRTKLYFMTDFASGANIRCLWALFRSTDQREFNTPLINSQLNNIIYNWTIISGILELIDGRKKKSLPHVARFHVEVLCFWMLHTQIEVRRRGWNHSLSESVKSLLFAQNQQDDTVKQAFMLAISDSEHVTCIRNTHSEAFSILLNLWSTN